MVKKILLVEDDKLLMRLLVDRINKEGYEISVAYNGKEGLEKAESENPDLIISDILMPLMTGEEMLKALKSQENTKNIPVIMLTNLSSEEDNEKLIQLGAREYFVKGNDSLEDLIGNIQQI